MTDFLRRIGLLHVAGKTYSGKNTGGEFETEDLNCTLNYYKAECDAGIDSWF